MLPRQARRLNRRALLMSLAGGFAAAAGFGVYRLLPLWARPRRPCSDRWLPTAKPGVVRVGRRYLATAPDESDLDVLLARLPEVGDARQLATDLCHLEAAVAEDFERGRVVLVDGWLLSQTEARAAAILALGGQG